MSNRIIKLATNLLNYAAEALIGTSVLMFSVQQTNPLSICPWGAITIH